MSQARPQRALSVLIVSRDCASQIGVLLAGIRAECERLGAEVIVLDNASRDGTPALVAREHGWVQLRRSLTDLGFAVAANLAAHLAAGRCLLLLHPEALPEPGCIAKGLALMESEPRVALAGGRLGGLRDARPRAVPLLPARFDDRLALRGLAARSPQSRLFGRFDRRSRDDVRPVDVDWVSGALLFVRTAAFRALGGFDERFFLFYEEVDLCRRARLSGWRVCHWPALQARHIGRASAGEDEVDTLPADPGFAPVPAREAACGSPLLLWHLRSALLYYRKHHGWAAAWAVNRLERAWQRLQSWCKVFGRGAARAEHTERLGQLRRAWSDTFGGRVSPPRPW